MCKWRAWLLPGLLTLLILTAIAILIRGGPIEADLTARSLATFEEDGVPWAVAELDGRDLTLTGTATTLAAQDAAIAAAGRVSGVHRVDVSGLDVLPLADPYTLEFVKTGEVVTVTGSFPDGATRVNLLDGIREGLGDRELIDETELARGAPLRFSDLATFAAAGLPSLATGSVSIDGSSLTVDAEAATSDGYREELARLASPPAGLDIASITLRPPRIDPYTWRAEVSESGVALSGFVPSGDVRASLVEAAGVMGSVEDRLALGSGAPDGFESAAGALLNQMASLDRASASISGRDLQIAGEARDTAGYNAANAFLGQLPEGFDSLSGRIAPPLADPYQTRLEKSPTGWILSGVLPSETARAFVIDASGGASMNDTATIARGAPEGVDIGELFASSVGILDGLVTGEATLDGNSFSLSGLASSFEGADTARDAIAALNVGSLSVRSDIARGPASPFTFSASIADDTATLDGFVPSEESKTAILSDIAALFPALLVQESLAIADGAPSDFDLAVRTGLRSLGRLDSGALMLTDSSIALTGLALHQRAIDSFADTAGLGLPGGFDLQSSLQLAPSPTIVDATACQATLLGLLQVNSIRFDTGSASIDPLSFGLLDRLARALQSCPEARVEVAGYTDAQGSESANLALSEARAASVEAYMVETGIAEGRLVAVGYGEANPIASNDTEEGRAQNRRIEFTVLAAPEPEPEPEQNQAETVEADNAGADQPTVTGTDP